MQTLTHFFGKKTILDCLVTCKKAIRPSSFWYNSATSASFSIIQDNYNLIKHLSTFSTLKGHVHLEFTPLSYLQSLFSFLISKDPSLTTLTLWRTQIPWNVHSSFSGGGPNRHTSIWQLSWNIKWVKSPGGRRTLAPVNKSTARWLKAHFLPRPKHNDAFH